MRYSLALLTAGALALSAGTFSTGAQASEGCFKLTPFSDILKLEFGAVTNRHQNVYGNWIAPGSYTLPVSGAYELKSGSQSVKRLGIVGTNITASFNGNLICGLDGTKGGAWKLSCSGGTGANYQNSGTLTQVSCAGLSPSSAATGRAAGAK